MHKAKNPRALHKEKRGDRSDDFLPDMLPAYYTHLAELIRVSDVDVHHVVLLELVKKLVDAVHVYTSLILYELLSFP